MMQEMMEKMKNGESKSDPKMELAMSKIEELKGLAEGMGMNLQELISKCEEGYESDEEEASEQEPLDSEEGKGNPGKARMIIAQLALRKPKGE